MGGAYQPTGPARYASLVKWYTKAVIGSVTLVSLLVTAEVFGPSKTITSTEIDPSCMRFRHCVTRSWGFSKACAVTADEMRPVDLPTSGPGDTCADEWLPWSSCSYSTLGLSVGCRLYPRQGPAAAIYSLSELWRAEKFNMKRAEHYSDPSALKDIWEPPKQFVLTDCDGPSRLEPNSFRFGLRSTEPQTTPECFVLDSESGARRWRGVR